jgi:hypothetical protein
MKTLIIAAVLTMAGLGPGSAHAQAGAVQGDFRYVRVVDPVSGHDRSFVMTPASTDRSRLGTLTWSCQSNGQFQVTLGAHQFLGRDSAPVQVAFDRRNFAAGERWPASPGGRGLSLPPGVTAAFNAEARASRNVVIRTVDARGASFVYSFGLQGLTQVLAQLPCARGS